MLQENSLNLKKSKKADLTNSLLKILDKEDIVTCDDDSPGRCPHVQSDAIIVDLMSILRKLSSVELSAVTTLGSLCDTLLRVIQSYGSKSDEIHIIMENYNIVDLFKKQKIPVILYNKEDPIHYNTFKNVYFLFDIIITSFSIF